MTFIRYERAEILIDLILRLQISRQGLSLDDIASQYSVSRRTAERFRDAIERLFPSLDEIKDGKGKKWRLPTQSLNILNSILDSDTISALETAHKYFKESNLEHHQKEIQTLILSLKSLLDVKKLNKLETDLEVLVLSEGLAMRPKSNIKYDLNNLEILRECILSCHSCQLYYNRPSKPRQEVYEINPYGFIFDTFSYLVAYNTEIRDYRLYRMDRIHKAVSLEKGFIVDNSFSLQKYREQSFGIYQDEQYEIELLFSKDVANEVQQFTFHPTQKLTTEGDGSIKLELVTGGLEELCNYLFKWGKDVRIISPKVLKDMMKAKCHSILENT